MIIRQSSYEKLRIDLNDILKTWRPGYGEESGLKKRMYCEALDVSRSLNEFKRNSTSVPCLLDIRFCSMKQLENYVLAKVFVDSLEDFTSNGVQKEERC